MTIIYDPRQEIYCVGMAQVEMVTYINAKDIVEAREEFISRMTWLFDEAVRKKLED
jgi:hypothetical protein